MTGRGPARREGPLAPVVIERLTATPYRLPLRGEWRTARGRLAGRAGWLVAAAAAGVTGWGECAPWPAAGTEAREEAARWLERAGVELAGRPLADALAHLDRSACTPAARCGLETALVDLAARLAGLPLAAWLAPRARARVPVNAFLGRLVPGVEVAARRAAATGFRVFKVKVGTADPGAELRALERLSAGLPPGVRLRLDANGAWPPSVARRFLRALAGLPVESLEEPLADPDVAGLARLRAVSPVPIALDESLARLGEDPVLRHHPVDRLVLKPMARGGLRRALDLARRAEAAGLACVVTTTVDTAVGTLAAAHLAAALPGAARVAHGLATSGWLVRDLAAVPRARGGELRLPGGPGTGAAPQTRGSGGPAIPGAGLVLAAALKVWGEVGPAA